MQMFYAASTGGFYTPEVHGSNIPADAVEVPFAEYTALIDGQADDKEILADENGYPYLRPVVRNPPTYQELRAAEYPPMADYLDGVVKGDQAQIDAYIAACQAVKAKYPKP